MSSAARDEGSALVEFLALAILLLIPIVYLILTLTQLHAGKFAAASAVQSAARVFIAAPDESSAHEHAATATRIALDDQGFTDVAVSDVLNIECSGECLSAGTRVHVSVSIPVHVPGIPFLAEGPTIFTAADQQLATVEQFRGEP